MIEAEVLNVEVGKILRGYLKHTRVLIKEGHQLQDASQRPALVIKRASREPVLIEHKIDSQQALLEQCRSRLESRWSQGEPVRVVIGLLSPAKLQYLKSTAQLSEILKTKAQFRWVICYPSRRFPEGGWLEGSLQDFAGCIDRIGVATVDLSPAIERIKIGLYYEAQQLALKPSAPPKLAQVLKREVSEQTTQLALAIILKAAIFHIYIANQHSKIIRPQQLLITKTADQSNLSAAWSNILEINYSPIFRLALNLLNCLGDSKLVNAMIRRLVMIALAVSKMAGAQGLVGTVFGELLKDHKLLASFHTKPTSAMLLAELAVSRLKTDWSKTPAIRQLRIADLAVGSGTLLLSVYRRIAEKHTLNAPRANYPSQLHTIMMEEVLTGYDIEPAAAWLTAARLAGEYPGVDCQVVDIYALPYGLVQIKGHRQVYKLGSLDLLTRKLAPILPDDDREKIKARPQLEIPIVRSHKVTRMPDNSLDLVIMNPQLPQPINQEGPKAESSSPLLAAFGHKAADQKEMSKILSSQLKTLAKIQYTLASHEPAGLASNFVDLAHIKLKSGGILALILPLAFMSGKVWLKTRTLLSRRYKELIFITIAADSRSGSNWSSNPDSSEVLVLGRKFAEAAHTKEATYITLDKRPATVSEAVEVALLINQQSKTGDIYVGENRIGHLRKASFEVQLTGQRAGIANDSLITLGQGLLNQELTLPQSKTVDLPVTGLGNLGEAGPYHSDISGTSPDKSLRGAFRVYSLEDRRAYKGLDYPMLWSHDTRLEKCMIVLPDTGAVVRPDYQELAVRTWLGYESNRRLVSGATRLHINRDFSPTSQSLGACLTPIIALGGRSWPSFNLSRSRYDLRLSEKAVCLWLNTTIGLIGRWYVSDRRQLGRSSLSISTLASIPTLDINQLSLHQCQQLADIFDEYAQQTLKSAYLAEADETRQAMDKAVLVDVLGLPKALLKSLVIIKKQWVSEVSVRSHK